MTRAGCTWQKSIALAVMCLLAGCGSGEHTEPAPVASISARAQTPIAMPSQPRASTDPQLTFLGTMAAGTNGAISALVRVDGGPAARVVAGDQIGETTIEVVGVDYVKVRRRGQLVSYPVGGQKAQAPAPTAAVAAVAQPAVDEAFERSLQASRLFLPQQK